MKAPTGGAIVNRTFFKGGRFMARAFQSVRGVADALRQLSRRPKADRSIDKLNDAMQKYMDDKEYTKKGGFYRLLADLKIAPNFDTGMTLGNLKNIENHLNINDKDKLSKHAVFNVEDNKLQDNDLLSKAKKNGYKLEHVLPFLSTIQKYRLPSDVITAIHKKDTDDSVKALLLAALMSEENGLFIKHKGGDPAAAGAEWYQNAMNPLDVAFHTKNATQLNDPNWGEVDWNPDDKKGPRLKYNGQTAWEHAPHQVLAKSVTAFTSGGKNPKDNALTADKMIDVAHARAKDDKNWVNYIPEDQQEELDKWKTKVADAGLAPDKIEPNTQKWDELLTWSNNDTIKQHNKQSGKYVRGFKSTGAYAVGNHVVALLPVGNAPVTKFVGDTEQEREDNRNLYKQTRSSNPSDLKKVVLPLVDHKGKLLPKAWGTQENVIENVRDLKRLLKHFQDKPDPMRAAAEFILTPQPVHTLHDILHIDLSPDSEDKNHVHQPELYTYKDGAKAKRVREVNLGYLEPTQKPNESPENFNARRTDEKVPGSWLFGPKFGPFLQNIHANTPVPKGQAADYFTGWDTQDVWRVRGHGSRSGGDPEQGAPRERERKTLWESIKKAAANAVEGGRHGATVAGEQAIDWLATKHLLDLFGLPGTKADYTHGAKAILNKAGHTHLDFTTSGELTPVAKTAAKEKPLKFDGKRGAFTGDQQPTPATPATPTRLARVISYVGGDRVPGAQRAIGVWDGGAEPSNVVETDPNRAAALAAQNRQKSSLWFEPGPGDDSLHVFTHPGAPAEARAMLNKHGVTYATLVPGPRGTQVHVVDPGGEFDGVLPGTPQKGRATFRRL